ncbi:unnamed protein product [Closterium sp. NIES-65]|nr:unnamed protein product [Closterium sp. NIES-65]
MAAAPGTLAVAPPHLLESMFPGMEFPRPFANGDVANSLANGESARLAQADVANSFYETGKRAGDNRRGGSSSVAGSSAAATSSSGAVDAADVAGLHAQRDAVLRGFEITEPARDDKETGEKAKYMASILEAYQKLLEERTQYHFGYPYNLDFDYGALIGLQHFSINNLGDPFIESNYGVHSRPFEVGVLNWFARLWDLDEGDYWGYITNCGTEGNLHGILVGLLCPLGPLPPLPLRLSSSHCPSSSPPPTSVPSSLPSPSREVLPKGVLYATRESHYSVFMAARMYRMECEKVATHTAGETGTQSFPSLLTPSLPLRPPRREVLPAGVLYASRESHYSVFKAARIYRMEREKSCGDTHKHTRSSPLPCSLSPKREVLPDGVLYATRESHYSVFKAARMYRMECEKVATHTARDIEVCFSQDGTCLSFSPSPLSQEGGPARRDGVLYASRESHYSVFKAARMYRMECEKVATHTAGDIETGCCTRLGSPITLSSRQLACIAWSVRRWPLTRLGTLRFAFLKMALASLFLPLPSPRREVLPDGVLYASRESHYSVFKAARMYRMECEKVATHTAGDIDCRDLAGKLARHRGRPAILNVNIGTHHGEGSSGRSQPGTTVKGAVDDLDLAITTLHEAGLSDHQLSPPRVLPSHVLNLRLLPSPGSLSSSPWLGAVDDLDLVITTLHEAGLSDEQFYIHCDGALFGLMLPFVKKAPRVTFKKPIGSVSVSGHKFVGCPMPCGVQIMRRCYLSALSSDIEYLASRDATIMGSRNGHAPIFLWYTLNKKGYRGFRKDVQRCLRNALHLHARLRAAGFGAMLNTLSSTVVFERPEEEAFVRRWQLACQGKVAHAVVMPSVSPEKVDLFVREFVASRERCRAAKAAADDDDDDDDDATAAAAAAAAAAATAAAATAADGSAAGGSTAGAAAVANGSAATSTDALTSDVCVADVIGPENCSCAAHVAIWRTRIEQDAVGRRRYSCYSDTSGDDASLHGSSSVQRLSSSVQRLS